MLGLNLNINGVERNPAISAQQKISSTALDWPSKEIFPNVDDKVMQQSKDTLNRISL